MCSLSASPGRRSPRTRGPTSSLGTVQLGPALASSLQVWELPELQGDAAAPTRLAMSERGDPRLVSSCTLSRLTGACCQVKRSHLGSFTRRCSRFSSVRPSPAVSHGVLRSPISILVAVTGDPSTCRPAQRVSVFFTVRRHHQTRTRPCARPSSSPPPMCIVHTLLPAMTATSRLSAAEPVYPMDGLPQPTAGAFPSLISVR